MARDGPNALEDVRRRSTLQRMGAMLSEPMFALLVAAVVVVITVALFAITFVPLLQTVLATEAVPFWDGLLVIAIGVVRFAIVETESVAQSH